MNGSEPAAASLASTVQPFNDSTIPRASSSATKLPPCVLFEDEHLVVVNKPPGWNTHAPSPYAGEGIYDWLKHREPRWASLAIIHRLDKETSGLLVFGKTPLANRSLTEQFTRREVEKVYVFLTTHTVGREAWAVRSDIQRVGDHYEAGEADSGGMPAETHFRVIRRNREHTWLEAKPLTGRTHQIRVHAAKEGVPVLGDELYAVPPSPHDVVFAPRLCLHAARITFKHPASRERVRFEAKVSFFEPPADTLRKALLDPESTDCYRVRHGASDRTAGFYADRLGDWLLAEADMELEDRDQVALLRTSARVLGVRGVYLKRLTNNAGQKEPPLRHVLCEQSPERFTVRENSVKFELGFNEGYSVGLFLDQRDNRRRLLSGHVAAGFPLREAETRNSKPEILNCFAYTCGFSVCAALGGARTTSLDLSKKYLEWGKRNFALNGLDPAAHDFIYGDAFDWLRRLAKKGRAFDAVLLDPPTFSQSKEGGVFRAEKDYGRLVTTALPVLKRGGVLFASTNAADWPPEHFLAQVSQAIRKAGRAIVRQHYVPQPPDFPISRAEPAYLKTVWLRVE